MLFRSWSTSALFDLIEISGVSQNWLNALNFKASYGEQGNMLDGQTPVMLINKGAYDSYYGEMTSSVSTFANPDLKWEKTRSSNMGLETSLFRNRFMASFEYYYKKTTDAFLNKPIADVNGYTSYIVNSGTIINRGYNASFTIIPVQNRNVSYILSGSVSKIKSRVDTAPG